MSSKVPVDKVDAEAYKTEHDDWKLKVRIKCQECHGVGWWAWDDAIGSGDAECPECGGKGFNVEEVHPDDIDKLLARKESQDFECICGKKEKILRPKEGQIAALQGAAMKIAQIKEAECTSMK
jgi:hypothetical protein